VWHGATSHRTPSPSSPCTCSCYFFRLKLGALPYHLRRSNNFTSRTEANATTHKQRKRTTHTNNTLHHHSLGEESKNPPQPAPHRQRCATAKAATRCKLKWLPELLHHELSPSSCTHKVADLSVLTLLRRNTPVAGPMKPPIPATLRGGLTSSTASLLCQELGYLRLLRKEHLRSAITKITTSPSMPTRGYTPKGPPHLPTNTGKAHHHNSNAKRNTTSRPPPLPQVEMGL
jgi:hypothetical protein